MLHEHLQDFFEEQGKEKVYWLGYSGGLDSHVLLHISSFFPIKLNAVYVNHHLHADSDVWALHCKNISAQLNVPFHEINIHLACDKGESVEEIAREKRYAALSEMMSEGDVLLTAHHQNDQAETLLLQLLRGSGTKGLSAMPEIKSFARGHHARPLLSFTRAELVKYAKENNLKWIEDSSNQNKKFTRNFIRHEVLPLLETRFPSAVKTIARSSKLIAASHQLLEGNIKQRLKEFEGVSKNSLSVSQLLKQDLPAQQLILRTWMIQQHCALPSQKKLLSICNHVLHAGWDKVPEVVWGNNILRRSRDEIFLAQKSAAINEVKSWDLSTPLQLHHEVLIAKKTLGKGLKIDRKGMTVRFRSGGETLYFPGRGHRSLKKMFNEWRVLPWLRDRLPLLYLGDVLAVVVGFYIHPDFEVKSDEEGWEVLLQSKE